MIPTPDITALDLQMAVWLGSPVDVVRKPGAHYVVWPGGERAGERGYSSLFFAFIPTAGAPSMAVASSNVGVEAVRALGLGGESPEQVERIATTVQQVFENSSCYSIDILCGSVEGMNLSLNPEQVHEHEPMDAGAVRWDGRNLADEVDGTIFSTADESGMTAWAGIKSRGGPAWDIKVETRGDMQRRGLARLVASHATERLQCKGITPFYAHMRSNVASAELAKALGYELYGVGVIAERRNWIPVDER